MSVAKDLRRQLDAAWHAVEAVDADHAAGRIGDDEHARQRADKEREIGRLFVSLRRAQVARVEQEDRRRPAADDDDVAPTAWYRRPVVLIPGALLVLVAGIGGGVAVTKWLMPETRGAASTTSMPTSAPPADTAGSAITETELQALRSAAMRADAPMPSLLELGHVLLDRGRVAEARDVYQKALGREPRNAEAVTHMGAVLYHEGRLDEALAKLDEALRIDPRYIHAHWDRTQYLFHAKRDYAAAIKAAEAFIEASGPGPDAENMKKLIAEARQQIRK